MKERIQKVLASAGVASRRAVEEMVRQGRVAVNGQVVVELPVLVDPAADRITVDGEPVRVRGPQRRSDRRHYFLLYKPKGVYSTNVAQGEQVRAVDLLPPEFEGRVYPVGRLDADSKGLLLLTDDGELTNLLTHPRYGVARTYRVLVQGEVGAEVVRKLEEGVWLADPHRGGFKTSPARVRIVHRSRQQTVMDVTLREGRNAAVRRMLAKLGHKARDVTRVAMGPLTLEGLSPGKVRPLNDREVRGLYEYVQRRRRGEGTRQQGAKEGTK